MLYHLTRIAQGSLKNGGLIAVKGKHQQGLTRLGFEQRELCNGAQASPNQKAGSFGKHPQIGPVHFSGWVLGRLAFFRVLQKVHFYAPYPHLHAYGIVAYPEGVASLEGFERAKESEGA
jgi:hypothetical protein